MTETLGRSILAVRPPRSGRMAAVVVSLAFGVAVAILAFRPHVFAGAVLVGADPAPPLEGLWFHTGQPADLGRYAGDVVLVSFGYTHCPDSCPTLLAMVARAREGLGEDADRVHVLMVTVDPARDSAEELQRHLAFFDPSFLGVTGPEGRLDQAASQYGVMADRSEDWGGDGYVLDHTSNLMAIDTGGVLRVVYPAEVDPGELTADLAELLG